MLNKIGSSTNYGRPKTRVDSSKFVWACQEGKGALFGTKALETHTVQVKEQSLLWVAKSQTQLSIHTHTHTRTHTHAHTHKKIQESGVITSGVITTSP